jgi:two-component system chemotaxis response regulator CheB
MRAESHLDEMPNSRQCPVVAIAGSAGSIISLREILASLPADFPAAVLYSHHLNNSGCSLLSDIFQWETFLNVTWAEPCDKLRQGTVYLCPPGATLSVLPDGTLGQRPSNDLCHRADRLFTSVAANYGSRAVAVVLSGGGDDGREGVYTIHDRGGTVIVQDARDGFDGNMPHAALATGCIDLLLPIWDIAPVLVSLVRDGCPLSALREGAARLRSCIRPRHLRAGLYQMLSLAVKTLRTDLGNIQLVDDSSDSLAIVAQRGFGLSFLGHFQFVARGDSSACGRAIHDGRPVSIPDVSLDPVFAPHVQIATAAGFRAVHSTPLIDRSGAAFGVL